MSSRRVWPPPAPRHCPHSPPPPTPYLLQALLQLLQRCHQPLVLRAQLGNQVRAVRLFLLLLGPRERPPGPAQQCALFFQPAHLELQLVHLGPRTGVSSGREYQPGQRGEVLSHIPGCLPDSQRGPSRCPPQTCLGRRDRLDKYSKEGREAARPSHPPRGICLKDLWVEGPYITRSSVPHF